MVLLAAQDASSRRAIALSSPQVWQLLSGEPLEAVDEPGVAQSVQVGPRRKRPDTDVRGGG